jgi:hypothetical protein
MKIQYLEIVTKEVDKVCVAYTANNGVQFGEPDAGLGNAGRRFGGSSSAHAPNRGAGGAALLTA